ncbi:MAG: hypothetical protein ACI9F9_000834 [Candidatus Paceibacteria bacterium]|jgi:hypothetical protein
MEWLRPAGWVLLGWLVPLWLLLRRKDKPTALATSTLSIWQGMQGKRVLDARDRSRRIPPRAWIWSLGVLLGALAVMAPHWPAAASELHYRLWVDRSPSMFLPVRPGASETRYVAALQSALASLQEAGVSATAREWHSYGNEVVRGEAPPQHWAETPRKHQPELDPALLEVEQWEVITDRARAVRAGLFASGGQAIHGLVGEWAGRALEWDGTLVVSAAELSPQRVWIAPELPAQFKALFEMWREERGYELGVGEEGAALAVLWSEPGHTEEGAPGRLHLNEQALSEFAGDPASFAAAWATRLDGALLPRAGHVPLSERQPAGEHFGRLGRGSASLTSPETIPPSAWLALGCLLAAIVAFFPRAAPGIS